MRKEFPGIDQTRHGKWVARHGAKHKHIGVFATKEEAFAAYVTFDIAKNGERSIYFEPPLIVDEYGSFRRIPLTQGKYALVDDADFYKVRGFKWFAKRCKRSGVTDVFYAARRSRGDEKITGPAVLMHNVVLNVDGGFLIDHADHDGLNNRRYNIRVASESQNNQNKRFAVRSLPRGVSLKSGRYNARITLHGTTYDLGRFDDVAEAASAYDQASEKMHGEFGIRNAEAA